MDTAAGKGKKLRPPWKGPAIITHKISPYLYKVIFKRAAYVVNHDRLKKCTDDSAPALVPTKGNKGKPYCICKQEEEADSDGFMVQCDFCLDWFHGRCVRISREEAVTVPKYMCPICVFKYEK